MRNSRSTPADALPHPRASLHAAGLALLVSALLVAGVVGGATLVEQRYLMALTPKLSNSQLNEEDNSEAMNLVEAQKNQGLALQRAALAQVNLLPLYGSSELLKGIQDKASVFFRNFPTGFEIFPVGKPGATSLVLAQKIAATGPSAPDRKVAISLSPSWFYKGIDPRDYLSNFSPQQALATLLNPHLSYGLKRDLARRLEQFPESAENRPLLGFFLFHLARSSPVDRWLYRAAIPLGLLETAGQTVQDHVQTAWLLYTERGHWGTAPEHLAATLDWEQLRQRMAVESAHYRIKDNEAERPQVAGATDFLHHLDENEEWTDFELLLRVLKELHFEPLLLAMPNNGDYLEEHGVTRKALSSYPHRLHALAKHYGVTVRDFGDHLEDTRFVIDTHDHLSRKGWIYYDQALDEFYHSRSLQP